jgi:hypothetical protein
MIITSTLVHTDLHYSAIQPLSFVYPHVSHLPNPSRVIPFSILRTPCNIPSVEKELDSEEDEIGKKRGLAYFVRAVIRFIFEGTENNMLLDWHGLGTFFKRLVWTALQGMGIGVVFGLPLWCLAVVIL